VPPASDPAIANQEQQRYQHPAAAAANPAYFTVTAVPVIAGSVAPASDPASSEGI
jgi:hypothetical protein